MPLMTMVILTIPGLKKVAIIDYTVEKRLVVTRKKSCSMDQKWQKGMPILDLEVARLVRIISCYLMELIPVSRRRYTIYFKNLESGELLADKLENTTGGTTWANDNKTVFYTTKDPVTLRSNKIYKHVLGTSQSEDVLVYEEKDETFSCGIYKSKSKKYLFIWNSQTLSSEFHYLDANDPDGSTGKSFSQEKKI